MMSFWKKLTLVPWSQGRRKVPFLQEGLMVKFQLELNEGLTGGKWFHQHLGAETLSLLLSRWVLQKPAEEPSHERLMRKCIALGEKLKAGGV